MGGLCRNCLFAFKIEFSFFKEEESLGGATNFFEMKRMNFPLKSYPKGCFWSGCGLKGIDFFKSGKADSYKQDLSRKYEKGICKHSLFFSTFRKMMPRVAATRKRKPCIIRTYSQQLASAYLLLLKLFILKLKSL